MRLKRSSSHLRFLVLDSDEDDDDDAEEQGKPAVDHDVPPTMNPLVASLAME